MKKATKKKLMSESEFQRHVLAAFKDDPNIKIFRRNVGGMKDDNGDYVRFGEAGQSDLWGWIVAYRCPSCNRLLEGIHFEIELKSGNGKLTEKQKNWLLFVAKNNGIAIELRPIETDPVGLYRRICQLLYRSACSVCCSKSKLNH